MSIRRDPFEALTLDQKALVNYICEQFEHALTSGDTARVEDCLAGRNVILAQLIQILGRAHRYTLQRVEVLRLQAIFNYRFALLHEVSDTFDGIAVHDPIARARCAPLRV